VALAVLRHRGRPGNALAGVAAEARAAGATAHEIGCDLASLDDVHAVAETVKELLGSGAVRPLRGLVANAGLSVADTRTTSADGYELTFAVNYLAHAQLIGDLLDSFATPARIVLVGSNTYYANWVRRMMTVPAAQWKDPLELAKPAGPEVSPTLKAAGVAYSDSKLAILYYAHELQRRAPEGINVAVFEPGFMPGTGLSRQHSPRGSAAGAMDAATASPWHFLACQVRARACVGDPRRTLGTPPRWRLRGHRQGTRRHAHREQSRPGASAVGRHSQASAVDSTSRQLGFHCRHCIPAPLIIDVRQSGPGPSKRQHVHTVHTSERELKVGGTTVSCDPAGRAIAKQIQPRSATFLPEPGPIQNAQGRLALNCKGVLIRLVD